MSDITRSLNFPLEIDFISICSYKGSQSDGDVKLLQWPRISLNSRHILIIEDIIDTGITMEWCMRRLKQESPASIKLCALLDKPSRHKTAINIDYLGFSIPDKFVVGYGLDYNEEFRNLPDICYLEK